MERKQSYTAEEVAKCTGEDGTRCWIILSGGVYDVTDYLDQHPGGGELITEFAGMDATSAFEDFGHSSDAKKILKKYEVGVLAKTEKSDGNNNKAKQTSKADRMSSENAKQRRKFLSIILGPCASA